MDLDFVDDTLIITRDAKKRDLLKRIGKEKKLSNAKIIGLEEFKKKYCFDYTKEAIFYIHKKYDVNMEIAKIFADNLSSSVTSLTINDVNKSAYKLFELLMEKYGIWICPNGGNLKEKVFRVGHMGALKDSDYDTLVKALSEGLQSEKINND